MPPRTQLERDDLGAGYGKGGGWVTIKKVAYAVLNTRWWDDYLALGQEKSWGRGGGKR